MTVCERTIRLSDEKFGVKVRRKNGEMPDFWADSTILTTKAAGEWPGALESKEVFWYYEDYSVQEYHL
jgi:hypothetical protein